MGSNTGDALGELFEAGHAELLALCNELEHIANDLPLNADKDACLRLGQTAAAVTTKAHRLEEDVLFAALLAARPHLHELAATIERLRLEHRGDEYHAEEVQDALLAFGMGQQQMSADALGYLLRGFFESQRRHIAFERELARTSVNDANFL